MQIDGTADASEMRSVGEADFRSSVVVCCFFLHDGSKLTIGRPGRVLTAVGMGNFGLRSFNFMLVAARMSSGRISRPSFIGTSGSLDRGGGGLVV